MVLLAIAAAPVLVLLFWFYHKDKYNKEPLHMLFFAFLGGCFSVVPTLLIGALWQNAGFKQEGSNLYLAFYAFIVVALTEDSCKYLFVRRIMRKSYVDEPYDAIIYCVMVSMGFAFVENLLYVFQEGFNVGVLRAFTAIPAHATFATIMGYYLGRAKFFGNEYLNTFAGIAGAVIMHGLYDYFLFIENIPLIQLGAFVSLIVGIRFSKIAIRIHNENSPFNPA